MNPKLVNSLLEIIRSLEPADIKLLKQRLQELPQIKETEGNLTKWSNPDEQFQAIKEWAESHSYDTPLLSDYAVSRAGIYEED
jgi:hypothetical protein